jgi:hypothetical protein
MTRATDLPNCVSPSPYPSNPASHLEEENVKEEEEFIFSTPDLASEKKTVTTTR